MKITTKNVLSTIALTTSLLLPLAANAQAPDYLTIINNFDKPINFTITINPESLPDLTKDFTLAPQFSTGSKVLAGKQAYVHGEDGNEINGRKNSVFFGVGLKANTVDLHGYISHGIAFSMHKNVIAFCSPESYRNHNRSCE